MATVVLENQLCPYYDDIVVVRMPLETTYTVNSNSFSHPLCLILKKYCGSDKDIDPHKVVV